MPDTVTKRRALGMIQSKNKLFVSSSDSAGFLTHLKILNFICQNKNIMFYKFKCLHNSEF